MEKKLRGLTGNLILALNVFILFLLLFESRLVIPAWLQVVGRMHPMILHFPLVLLVVAMGLEFFRFSKKHKTGEFYERFATILLAVGAVLAGITVIMGLFLSREEGYGAELDWHKWSGVGVMILASLVFFIRQTSWYNRAVARVSAVLILLLLVVTGHYGAVLTHGPDFLLAPVTEEMETAPVALEQAEVFEHVIKPIFQGKCISCHNPSKAKGGLLFTDSITVARGGKSGKLFVAGHPELSLLMERIHLPPGNKKRMPPVGKPALTEEEIVLLTNWIKSVGPYNQRILDYPENDSLRILASALFNTPAISGAFAFAAADPTLIKKLNNDYRVITPVAAGSPALNVNLFNSNAWSGEVLEELLPLKEQVISLNLARIPVENEDLKTIAKFANLQTLNLNFSGISGAGLKELSVLHNIRSLSLSGTDIGIRDLPVLNSLKELKNLSLWNTSVTAAEIESYKIANKQLVINAGTPDEGSFLKLNLPQAGNEFNVFSTPVTLKLLHPVKGVQLRYTTDGTRPDSINSPMYEEGKVLITKNSNFKVRAFKQGWIGSEEALFSFYQSRFRPDSMALLTRANEVYKANGVASLFDQVLGNPSNYYSGSWIGFSRNNAEIILKFNDPADITSIAFNSYEARHRELFLPVGMEIWGGESPDRFRLIRTIKFSDKKQDKPARFLETIFPKTSFRYLKLVIKPRAVLPPGSAPEKKGLFPVMLLDEILLN
ncbi:MAG: c-type cytochrome domain-containing protein [Chitinophagaceae bacterium]